MRWILWGAAAAGLVLGGLVSSASAQMGGGMAYDRRPALKKPAPRAKRYYYRSPRSAAGGTCGLYKYWTREGCKDARTTPPDLK